MLSNPLRLRIRLEAVECDAGLSDIVRASAEWSSNEIAFTAKELDAVVEDLKGTPGSDGARTMMALFMALIGNTHVHDVLIAKLVGQLAVRYDRARLAATS